MRLPLVILISLFRQEAMYLPLTHFATRQRAHLRGNFQGTPPPPGEGIVDAQRRSRPPKARGRHASPEVIGAIGLKSHSADKYMLLFDCRLR